jgi:GWxTD domain-containing protein
MRRIFLTCMVALSICGSALAQQQQQQIRSGDRPVYVQWLDADVAYIITPLERQAFLKLKTDEERNQFIAAFWQRRDPDAATAQNEFRDEHYERIAHANLSFGFGATQGWRTDRGRVFILQGKPDTVEKTSSGEVWTYRYIQGLGAGIKFEFVDATGTGDFRLLEKN